MTDATNVECWCSDSAQKYGLTDEGCPEHDPQTPDDVREAVERPGERGETDPAYFTVASRHHLHDGRKCLCGFDSGGRARSATEHVLDEYLSTQESMRTNTAALSATRRTAHATDLDGAVLRELVEDAHARAWTDEGEFSDAPRQITEAVLAAGFARPATVSAEQVESLHDCLVDQGYEHGTGSLRSVLRAAGIEVAK